MDKSSHLYPPYLLLVYYVEAYIRDRESLLRTWIIGAGHGIDVVIDDVFANLTHWEDASILDKARIYLKAEGYQTIRIDLAYDRLIWACVL